MKTKKGAYRYVVFGKNVVFKLPAIHYVLGVIKAIPKMVSQGDGKFIWKEFKWGWRNFLRGIRENRSEYLCWKRMRSSFLVPTYANFFGLMNVQKLQRGIEPTREEMVKVFAELPLEARQSLQNVESHCLEPGNFLKTDFGYILVDYDNGTTPAADRYPFTDFLERWHTELEAVLIPKIK